MIEAGVTSADIARECDVHPSFVGHVVSGRVRTERIRQAIACRLGVQVTDLWPTEHLDDKPI